VTTTTEFDVTMPQLGETVSEGTVINWLADVGAEIEAGDALLEVSTDKVDTELPSPVSGVLTEILASAGDTVVVGSVIARIEIDGEAMPSTPDEPSTPEPVVPAPLRSPAPAAPSPSPATWHATSSLSGTTVATPAGDRLRVSPVARRLAAERQIDVETLVGTGPTGAIIKRDVLASEGPGTAAAAPVPVAVQPSSSLTAQLQVRWAAIHATNTDHPLAAFVIRALVDSLRGQATTNASLGAFVEPEIRYVHAGSGQSVSMPDAAGLRISALSQRLATLSDVPFDAAVTIIDSSDQNCALSGLASSALSVGIGPRRTIPTATTSGTGMAIVFSDVVDLTITADQTLISVAALTALTNQLKLVLETREWSTEV
jgi:hypothetical protein